MATKNKYDAYRKRAEDAGLGRRSNNVMLPEGVDFFSPKMNDRNKNKDGKSFTTTIDVLPYVVSDKKHPEGIPVGETWSSRIYSIHRDMGPMKETITCPRSVGKACPICEEAERLFKEGNEESTKLAKVLKAKERALYNIVLLDKGEEQVVRILDHSTFLFDQILVREIQEAQEERGPFFELEGGQTIKVRWVEEKSKMGVKVTADRIDFIPRETYGPETLDAVVDLDTVLVVKEYDELQAMLMGAGDEDQGPAADDEPPAASIRTPRRGVKPTSQEPEQPEGGEPEGGAGGGDDENVCVACEGTKKNSMGGTCRICNGTGMKPGAKASEPATPPARGRVTGKPPAAAAAGDDPDWPPTEGEEPATPPARGRVTGKAPAAPTGRRVVGRGK